MNTNIVLRLARRSLNLVFSTAVRVGLYPWLRMLGYEPPLLQSAIPPSHFYRKTTLLNTIYDLHKLPSVKTLLYSRRQKRSFDESGAIPWITFPAIEYLKTLPLQNFKIVEFGSGASTLWFAARCKSLTSYEFDAEYFQAVRGALSDNKNVRLVEVQSLCHDLEGSNDCPQGLIDLLESDKEADLYGEISWRNVHVPNLIQEFSSSIMSADLVLVDGGMRSFILGIAATSASEQCFIVVDNADRPSVRRGVDRLLDRGFVEIPFIGFGPMNGYEWRTSVLSKKFTCRQYD